MKSVEKSSKKQPTKKPTVINWRPKTAAERRKRVGLLVKALVGGKYIQATAALCRVEGRVKSHCVMGVATELAIKAGLPILVERVPGHNWLKYQHRSWNAPDIVLEWFGFKTFGATYHDKHGKTRSIIQDNDDGVNFPKLAALLQSEPKGMFTI